MPLSFSYKAYKHSTELFTSYQGITEEYPDITAPHLLACIRLLTQQVEKIFDNLSEVLKAKELISSIIQGKVETADILKLVESYPLRERKKFQPSEVKESALIAKLGLLGKVPFISPSEQTEQRKQALIQAVTILRGFFQQESACYRKHLPSGLLPTEPEKRETLLAKLMPAIADILETHLFSVVDPVNAKAMLIVYREARKAEQSKMELSTSKSHEFNDPPALKR